MAGKSFFNFRQHRPFHSIALFLFIFLAAPSMQPRTAHADAANNFVLNKTVFGAYDSIIVELGVLTIDATDSIIPASNIYIVPNGSVTPGVSLADLDPAKVPNVIQGFGGGGFLDEIIGFTKPDPGKIGPGVWDIVEDANQNGKFDGPDTVLSPAFTVVIPVDVPVLPDIGILGIKANALAQSGYWQNSRRDFDRAFAIASAVNLAASMSSLSGIISLIFDSHPIRDEAKDIAKDIMEDTANHYLGISADPPDPDFQQNTPIGDRQVLDPVSNDPLDISFAELGTILASEAALLKAWLASIERYQGADAAGNGDWALIHARAIKGYTDLLAGQLISTNTALADLSAALSADARPLDTTAADLQVILDQVGATGFTDEQLQELWNLGFSDAKIGTFKNSLLNQDLSSFSKAGLVATLSDIQSTNTSLITNLGAFAVAIDASVATLAGDPMVTDAAPTADAGGPYLVAEGALITFDGTSSAMPGGSIVSYEWDLDGDGTFDDATGATPTFSYQNAFRGLVGLLVTNSAGLSNIGYTPIAVINVNSPPGIDASSPTDSGMMVEVGSPREFSLTASDPDAGDTVSLEWFVDGVSVATDSPFLYSPAVSDVGLHTLDAVVTDSSPLGGTVVRSWSVHVLEPDGDGDGYTLVGGDCNDGDINIHPGQPEVVGNGVDDDCDSASLDADAPPLAAFFTDPIVGVINQPVEFFSVSADPNGAENITGLDWSFGDGASDNVSNPMHSYSIGGSYPVTLTVTDAQGNTGVANHLLNVFDVAETIRISEPNLADQDVLGTQADDNSSSSDVSDDGRWVVFRARANNLVLDNSNPYFDIFMRDTITGEVRQTSVHSDGTKGDGNCFYPSMTPDGRFVIFTSYSSNLVGELNDDGDCMSGCVTGSENVFLRDRDTDENGVYDEPGNVETSQVNLASDDVEIHSQGHPMIPAVSADGNVVAFQSTGTTHIIRIFVRDRQAGTTDFYPKDIAGDPAFDHSFLVNKDTTSTARHVLSDDGRYVVYISSSNNLVGTDTDDNGVCDSHCATGGSNIFVTDLETGKNILMSVNSLGHPATYEHWQATGSWNPAMSGDGRFVTFSADPDNLIVDEFGVVQPNVNSAKMDVYLHDRDVDGNGTFDEPNVCDNNGDGIFDEPCYCDIDGDGIFDEPCPDNNVSYRILTELINVDSCGSPATGTSYNSDVSDDGRFVVFDSPSPNLPGLPGEDNNGCQEEDTNTYLDVFVRDRLTGLTSEISLHNDGTSGNLHSTHPSISSDGRFVTYMSGARNLIGIDVNGDGLCHPSTGDIGCDSNLKQDIFLRSFDMDADGVAGENDLCLNSLPGEPIDPEGCGLIPGINIDKTPDLRQVLSGGEATFTITVRNSGEVDLTNVEVSDPSASNCDAVIGLLTVGQEVHYDCTQTGIVASFTNSADAVGTPPVGEDVSAADTAEVVVITPAVTIEKTPEEQHVVIGSDVLFSITVSNTGDIGLSNVTVADALSPGCDKDLGPLAAAETATYFCLAKAVTADLTNAATVTGLPPAGPPVSDTDTAEVTVYNPIEYCDGIDNDGDGYIDEDFPELGNTCSDGVGECSAGGVRVCTADGLGTECNAVPGTPSTEICDGLDNDCDGLTDDADQDVIDQSIWYADGDVDGFGDPNNTTQSCAAPAGYVADSTDCNDANGAINPAAAEACDNIDNNCNGSVDEAFPELGNTCAEGVGECSAGGVKVCTADGAGTECNAVPGIPSSEICDGLDNDCDGAVDNNLTPPLNDNQTGICQESVQVCNGASGWTDSYGDISGYEPIEVSCDGLDNDCDGVVDNNGTYLFKGFQRPIKQDGSSVFNAGSTVPVKIVLTGCSGQSIPTATVIIRVFQIIPGGTEQEKTVRSSGKANYKNFFRRAGKKYIYNLSTKGYAAGTYRIAAVPDKGESHSVIISLRDHVKRKNKFVDKHKHKSGKSEPSKKKK
jgi:uncharacterized repeat protein (TIGR01451 family)